MGALAVQITDENSGQWIESRCVVEGFLPGQRSTAVPMRGATTIAGVGAVLAGPALATRLNPQHAEALARVAPSPAAAHSIESVFHPVIVTGASLPTVRVPIKRHYAVELFDDTLSAGRLWGREKSVALRREHVYFRTPTARSLLNAPARLLCQVTGDARYGGGTLRARSHLDEAVVGDVDQLISRFSHLGVLNRTKILGMARAGKVMALRFSHTIVFPKPISLAEYRGIMAELEPGVGLAHRAAPACCRTCVRTFGYAGSMTTPVVLLSVRSPHVQRLLSGTKTVEFRRRPWKVPAGATVLVYESRDRRAIVGSLIVESTAVGSPSAIWATYGSRSGQTRGEYEEYLVGATVAVAISVGRARQLEEPLILSELRRRSPTFHVPQSYRFMAADELVTVLNGERHQLLGYNLTI